jgi:AcrR family transcriptional regulator
VTQAGAEITAREIRRVALQMFSQRGYDGSSIRDIAEAVGIKGASLYNHFRSKEGILWDLTTTAFVALHEGWNAVREDLAEASPAEQIAGFVRAHVRYHAEKHSEAAIINAQLSKLSPEHYEDAVKLRREYELILMGLVEDALASGNHAVPDVRLTVFAILQMATGVSTWYRPDGPLGVDELCDIYSQLALKLIANVDPSAAL